MSHSPTRPRRSRSVLIVRAIARPTRWSFALAAGICAIAPFVRGDSRSCGWCSLLSCFALAVASAAFSGWRASWTAGTGRARRCWPSARPSPQRHDRAPLGRVVRRDRVLQAADARTRALGVRRAGVRARRSPAGRGPRRARRWPLATRRGNVRAFGVTGSAAVAVLRRLRRGQGRVPLDGLRDLVLERNVIYLAPLLLVGTALVLERRKARAPAALAATARCRRISSRPLRTSSTSTRTSRLRASRSLAFANRTRSGTSRTIERRCSSCLRSCRARATRGPVLTRAQRVALRRSASRSPPSSSPGVSRPRSTRREGEQPFAERLYEATPQPVDWVDRVDRRRARRSISVRASSTRTRSGCSSSGTARSTGLEPRRQRAPPVVVARPRSADGTLTPRSRGQIRVVRERRRGRRRARCRAASAAMTLFPSNVKPVRLRYAQTGVDPDGWMGATRLLPDTRDRARARLRQVVLSRRARACRKLDPGGRRRCGSAQSSCDRVRPARDRHAYRSRSYRHSLQAEPGSCCPRGVPYHVEVTISPDLRPAEIDPDLARRARARRTGRVRFHPARAASEARSSRSGCLRTNRAIPRRCQSVWRLRKRLSITAAYAWWTTASGTSQRSQPAFAAR